MTEKNTPKEQNDAKLKAFVKSGGRSGAETDFDTILKRAVKPKKVNKSSKKK